MRGVQSAEAAAGTGSTTSGEVRTEPSTPDPAVALYHELRAPLSLIATLAASVADQSDGAARRRSLVIYDTAERLLRTAEAVMAAVREPAGAPTDGESFLPAVVAQRALEPARDAGFQVQTRCAPGLDHALVRGRPVVFEALLQTLVSNAVDHGDRAAPLVACMTARGKTFRMTLANRAGRRGQRGLGLGHFLGARLAEQLGGSVELERRGDEFTARVELPLMRRVEAIELNGLRA